MKMLGARDVIVENVTRLGDVPRGEQFEYFVVLLIGSSMGMFLCVAPALFTRTSSFPKLLSARAIPRRMP
jgi:hypothetical protein